MAGRTESAERKAYGILMKHVRDCVTCRLSPNLSALCPAGTKLKKKWDVLSIELQAEKLTGNG